MLLSYKFENPLLKKYALMHDAAEYVFGDLPAPIKVCLPDYKAMIQLLETAIYRKVGLLPGEPPELKVFDKRICGDEIVMLRQQPECDRDYIPFGDVDFKLWPPDEAQYQWWAHFYKYWGSDAVKYILGDAASEC